MKEFRQLLLADDTIQLMPLKRAPVMQCCHVTTYFEKNILQTF